MEAAFPWCSQGTMTRLTSESACLLLAALTPASCFFTGTQTVVPARISPRSAASSSFSMAAQAPIAWPDEITTPLVDQPTRARILAVAPGDVASPFNDRGNSVPWYQVRFGNWAALLRLLLPVATNADT